MEVNDGALDTLPEKEPATEGVGGAEAVGIKLADNALLSVRSTDTVALPETRGLAELPLLSLLVRDRVAAALRVAAVLPVPPGAKEGEEKCDGVGSAEAVNSEGEALGLEPAVWDEAREGLAELVPQWVADNVMEGVGKVLREAGALAVPGRALPVDCTEAVEQRLEVEFKEGVGCSELEALVLALEFHTDTVGVNVVETEAEEVEDKLSVEVALEDWLEEAAAEELCESEGV